MTTVRVGGTIEATADVVFACLSDYKQAPLFIDGLESLEPAGRITTGEGAKFDALMKVGPRRFAAIIELSALEEDSLVTWSAAGGDERSITFRLRAAGGGTQVVLEISYAAPGGIAGFLLATVVEETVRSHAHASMRRLRAHMLG